MTVSKDDLAKVGKLLALAQDNDSEESRNAAIQAARLMKQHRLALVPEEEIERIRKVVGEGQQLAAKYQAEATQKMMLGALAGYLFGQK